MRRVSMLACATLLLAGAAHAQTTARGIRGTIQALNGNVLTVDARDGSAQRITLAAGYTVGAIVPATIDKIKPGTTIGIVGFGPPSHQRAAVISIFPPGQKVNEAQFAWDSAPDSTMTNAPVTADVDSTNGRELTVTVKGQPVQVAVPPNTVVQAIEPGTPAMLEPGAKVILFAQPAADGSLTASRVNVGKDGYTLAN